MSKRRSGIYNRFLLTESSSSEVICTEVFICTFGSQEGNKHQRVMYVYVGSFMLYSFDFYFDYFVSCSPMIALVKEEIHEP